MCLSEINSAGLDAHEQSLNLMAQQPCDNMSKKIKKYKKINNELLDYRLCYVQLNQFGASFITLFSKLQRLELNHKTGNVDTAQLFH